MSARPEHPLGVEPLRHWRRRCPEPELDELLARYQIVNAAIDRYRAAGLPAPVEWLGEIGSLVVKNPWPRKDTP